MKAGFDPTEHYLGFPQPYCQGELNSMLMLSKNCFSAEEKATQGESMNVGSQFAEVNAIH